MSKKLMIKHRRSGILHNSLGLNGIAEILNILIQKPIHFSQICRVSKIKFRNAVLKYLNFCKEKGLVESNEELLLLPNGRGVSKKVHYYTVYTVSDKGRIFLELVT